MNSITFHLYKHLELKKIKQGFFAKVKCKNSNATYRIAAKGYYLLCVFWLNLLTFGKGYDIIEEEGAEIFAVYAK